MTYSMANDRHMSHAHIGNLLEFFVYKIKIETHMCTRTSWCALTPSKYRRLIDIRTHSMHSVHTIKHTNLTKQRG